MFTGFDTKIFDDPEFKEDSVREVIIAPILAKLGYLVTGSSRIIRSRTLKNPFIRVGTRNHPVTTIPDYTLLHDEKPIFVLDAKGPKESVLKHEHIQQAYSYAIHPEIKCNEFGLCNGRQLAIFNVNQTKPILILNFEEFEAQWDKIEKHLSVKYLLKPALRKFSPDLGFKLKRFGINEDTELIMPGVRLNLFGRVNEQIMTAGANCDFGDIPHCASFDFELSLLDQVVAGLPKQLKDMFCDALSRAPFQAAAGLVIELDITAKLGAETKAQYETFIPLVISEIHESRFNPTQVPGDPNDIPAHVFQLRQMFKMREE